MTNELVRGSSGAAEAPDGLMMEKGTTRSLHLFGPSKIGDLGKGLGDGIRHFKDVIKDGGEKRDESK